MHGELGGGITGWSVQCRQALRRMWHGSVIRDASLSLFLSHTHTHTKHTHTYTHCRCERVQTKEVWTAFTILQNYIGRVPEMCLLECMWITIVFCSDMSLFIYSLKECRLFFECSDIFQMFSFGWLFTAYFASFK